MPAYSYFWEEIGDNTAHSLQTDASSINKHIGKKLKKPSMRRFREVVDAIAASVSLNAAAALTYPRVQAEAAPGTGPTNHGARTIETVTVFGTSETTNAADVAQADDMALFDPAPPSYPVDPSGYGGGGALDKAHPLT